MPGQSRDSISTALCQYKRSKSPNDPCGATVQMESRDCEDIRESTVFFMHSFLSSAWTTWGAHLARESNEKYHVKKRILVGMWPKTRLVYLEVLGTLNVKYVKLCASGWLQQTQERKSAIFYRDDPEPNLKSLCVRPMLPIPLLDWTPTWQR